MVKKMKYLTILMGICIFISCSKDDDDYTFATLEGYDLRKCACCGGVLVSIDSKPDEVYQWNQKTGDLGIKYEDKFPMKVKIKYHFLAQTCVASAGELEITSLVKL